MRLLDQCTYHRLGILARHSNEHHVARMSLDQGCDLAVVTAAEEITFPVTRDGSIFCLGRSFTDRYSIDNMAVIRRLLRVMPRAAYRTCASQMPGQLLLQGPAGLDVQGLVDRLVGHLHRLVIWIGALQPPRDLTR